MPTEAIENDMPSLLIRRYALRPDSGGAGRRRGGMGVVLEFLTTSPYTVVTSRAMDRYLFQPPGRLGGQFLHKRLKDAITRRFEEGEPVQPAQVAALLAELESEVGTGYPKRREPVTASP